MMKCIHYLMSYTLSSFWGIYSHFWQRANGCFLFLPLAAQVIVQVFIPVIVVGEVPDASGKLDSLKSATPFTKCYIHEEKWGFG